MLYEFLCNFKGPFMYVCVMCGHICMSLFVYMYAGACGGQRLTLSVLPQQLSTLSVLWVRSSHQNLRFNDSANLADPGAPGISHCPPPQHWDYKLGLELMSPWLVGSTSMTGPSSQPQSQFFLLNNEIWWFFCNTAYTTSVRIFNRTAWYGYSAIALLACQGMSWSIASLFR